MIAVPQQGGYSRALALPIGAVFALSSFVLVEPAPFDLACLLLGLFLLHRLRLPAAPDMMPAVVLVGVFALFNVFSAMFAADVPEMVMFMGTTFFLMLVACLVCCMVATWPQAGDAVLGGYCLSLVISTAITLAVVAGVLPLDVVMYDASRVQAFFKDPNVYGPSLVVAILYLLTLLERMPERPLHVLGLVAAALLLMLGIVFAGSRAAWMNLALSLAGYIVLRGLVLRGRAAFRFWAIVLAASALIAFGTIAVIAASGFETFLDERSGLQDYDADRFGAQQDGLELALEQPLGGGPGQFEARVGVLGISAHSLYVRTLMENGVGGFLSLMLFLGLTQLVAIRTALARSPSAATAAVIAASLLGTLVNGVFVDTLHWRSLWIQVGLAWGLYAVCLQQQRFNRWHQLVAARTN